MMKAIQIMFIILLLMFFSASAHSEETNKQPNLLQESAIMLNMALAKDIVGTAFGIQGVYSVYAIPSQSSYAHFVYFGGNYHIADTHTISLMGGISMNFPEKKNLPLLAFTAGGTIQSKFGYYMEIDALMSLPITWMYSARGRYIFNDNVDTGIYVMGVDQQPTAGPFLRYISSTSDHIQIQLEAIAFVAIDKTITPTIGITIICI